jgi:hypothetical protein
MDDSTVTVLGLVVGVALLYFGSALRRRQQRPRPRPKNGGGGGDA